MNKWVVWVILMFSPLSVSTSSCSQASSVLKCAEVYMCGFLQSWHHPPLLYPAVFLWLVRTEQWEDNFDVQWSASLQSSGLAKEGDYSNWWTVERGGWCTVNTVKTHVHAEVHIVGVGSRLIQQFYKKPFWMTFLSVHSKYEAEDTLQRLLMCWREIT